MTPEQLRAAGEALYGPGHTKRFADDMKVSQRTVERWRAGTLDIPDDVACAIIRLCQERRERLEKIIAFAREKSSPFRAVNAPLSRETAGHPLPADGQVIRGTDQNGLA